MFSVYSSFGLAGAHKIEALAESIYVLI